MNLPQGGYFFVDIPRDESKREGNLQPWTQVKHHLSAEHESVVLDFLRDVPTANTYARAMNLRAEREHRGYWGRPVIDYDQASDEQRAVFDQEKRK